MKKSVTPGEKYLNELTWEEKAQQNPLYGVMSVDEFALSGSEPTTDELTRFFDDGAGKVGRWILPWLMATYTRSDASILEFGCGMGRLVRSVRESYPNVTGIDISSTMVGRATRYVPGATFATIGEAGRVPLPDASIDRIYSYAVFQHIDRWSVVQRSLAEVARVLKPGGHVKLQFDMAFAPDFASAQHFRLRAYALERQSVVYGWARSHGVPIPGIKLIPHGHWRGARPGYSQLLRCLHRNGLHTLGMEHFVGLPHLVWVLAHKPVSEDLLNPETGSTGPTSSP